MTTFRPGSVAIRPVSDADRPIFFAHQLDPKANRMAAFTAKDRSDREAFDRHWRRVLGDPAITIRTILIAYTLWTAAAIGATLVPQAHAPSVEAGIDANH